MVRREEEVRIRSVEKAQGGEGTVTFYDWLLPEEAMGHGKVFSKLVVPPGCSIGYHVHQGTFEAYLVLEGEATVNDNGEEIILKKGDMNLCKEGEGHSTTNNTDKDLVLMALIFNA